MDGKLAGILERNDGLCHLNGTDGEPGYYTHSEILDYPSISQVSAVVQQNSFLTIFAVIPRYKGPAKHDIRSLSASHRGRIRTEGVGDGRLNYT